MQEKKFNLRGSLKKTVTRENVNSIAKYVVLIASAIWLWFFLGVNKGYIIYAQDGTVNKNTLDTAIVSVIFAVLTIILALIKIKWSDRVNQLVSWALFFLSPVYCYFAFEFFQKSIYTIVISSIRKRYILLDFIILSVIVLTFLIITNSIKIAVITMTIVINLFGVINYYIYSFRGVALVASDVFSIQTAASVANDYKLFMDYHICYMIIMTLFIVTVMCKLKSFKAFPTWKLRVPATVVYVAYLAICLHVFVFSNQLAEWNVKPKLFNPHSGYRKYGTFVAFVRSINPLMVKEPEGYSVKLVEDIAEEYGDNTGTGENPNVIIIMDESFADLKTLGDFETNEDYMPFIRSLDENTIKGWAYSSVFGGNTANSEFEFLTGNSMGLLPAGAIVYSLYIKDKFPSIVYNFESLNYTGNLAMHPYLPTGFRRATVYPMLGFEQFISLSAFSDSEKLRGLVSDEANFEKIIETYEASKVQSDEPFFMFNITMQNHGGYGNAATDPNFETKIKITDEDYYDAEAETYLSLVKYTDEAVEQLIEYFENVDDPTVIVFFGDHQPGLSKTWFAKLFGKSQNDLTTEELMTKYKVPFFAWANYDIQEETVDGISLNYLSAYIFNKIGLELTPYQQYLLSVHEQVPVMNSVGYYGVDGKLYDYEDVDSPYYDLINEYRSVQYNNVHDRGNRVDEMFYLN
ncbi:LTA synthase family protein [Konateibacter massiliensis]|uniref:LTA synthase family protein n=1 Tax=Konateibacter massiliensis TaxID=2002841 RepID=UPI000C157361|nr:alkaline phosphatase family protein [Konateibacter massiliensis]